MRHARATAVVLTLLVAAGLVPTAGLATHEAEKPVETQYTFRVDLGDEVFGEENVHSPDQEPGSIVLYLTGAPESFQLSHLLAHSPLDTTGCEVTDIAAGGIDRGNDDRYTETDTSLVGAYEEQGNTTSETGDLGPEDDPGPIAPEGWDFRMRSWIDFWDEGDFGGNPTTFHPGDEGLIALQDCVIGPTQPGWYRGWGKVNGTNPDTGDPVSITAFSNWNYVCECDSYDEAVDTIGAPPEGYTVEAGSTDGNGASGEPTPTPGPTPTATATATETVSTPAGDTPDESTPTATAAPPTVAGSPTPTPTDVAPDATDGDGPGFGILAATLGVLAAALLARRVG